MIGAAVGTSGLYFWKTLEYTTLLSFSHRTDSCYPCQNGTSCLLRNLSSTIVNKIVTKTQLAAMMVPQAPPPEDAIRTAFNVQKVASRTYHHSVSPAKVSARLLKEIGRRGS